MVLQSVKGTSQPRTRDASPHDERGWSDAPVAAISLYTKVLLCILNSIVGGGEDVTGFQNSKPLTPMSVARAIGVQLQREERTK